MSGYDFIDFRRINPILHKYTPDGKRTTLDRRLQRYMLILYAASLPIFEQHYKGDRGNGGYTLYSLMRIAKDLGYKFDRTKSSLKIYADQENVGRVRTEKIGNKTIYMLTKEGISYCKYCMKIFLEMLKIQPSAWDPHTENMKEKFDRAFAAYEKLSSEKEQKVWLDKNPGVLFAQPTKEEHKLDLLLQKIKSLS